MKFTIESADRKRIKRVKITLPEKFQGEPSLAEKLISLPPILLFFSLLSFLLSGCEEDYVPKQRAYFRISLPEKKYQPFTSSSCPFSFEIPVYSNVVPDTERNSEPCWFNLEFPQFKGTLYLSYKPVTGELKKYIEDSRALSMKHISRASGMQEESINDPAKKLFGNYYSVKGNAASCIQFYITDSMKNFIRGSLYFYAVPNPDSIAPVQDFIEKDIKHLVETFEWK
jgi:gliding motility-associated lipoprotein GldD